MIPFFLGEPADTRALIAQVAAAREHNRAAVDAALAAMADASRAAIAASGTRQTDLAGQALIAAVALAARAMDALAAATALPLVPPSVVQIRSALARFGGTAKTTGAGGGDVGIALIPRVEDATAATRSIIEAGCKPLALAVDQTGVDLRPDAQ
jgi:phosphomevalonate kinase